MYLFDKATQRGLIKILSSPPGKLHAQYSLRWCKITHMYIYPRRNLNVSCTLKLRLESSSVLTCHWRLSQLLDFWDACPEPSWSHHSLYVYCCPVQWTNMWRMQECHRPVTIYRVVVGCGMVAVLPISKYYSFCTCIQCSQTQTLTRTCTWSD